MFADCNGTFSTLVIVFVVGWCLLKAYRAIDNDGSITTAIKEAFVRVLSKLCK